MLPSISMRYSLSDLTEWRLAVAREMVANGCAEEYTQLCQADEDLAIKVGNKIDSNIPIELVDLEEKAAYTVTDIKLMMNM